MNSIIVKNYKEIPKNYTGVAVFHSLSGTECWLKEGKYHREDGPAIKYKIGHQEWYLDDKIYTAYIIIDLFEYSIFLGTEKGRYNLPWLKFMTETGIEYFPIIPGMDKVKKFQVMFKKLEQIKAAPTT